MSRGLAGWAPRAHHRAAERAAQTVTRTNTRSALAPLEADEYTLGWMAAQPYAPLPAQEVEQMREELAHVQRENVQLRAELVPPAAGDDLECVAMSACLPRSITCVPRSAAVEADAEPCPSSNSGAKPKSAVRRWTSKQLELEGEEITWAGWGVDGKVLAVASKLHGCLSLVQQGDRDGNAREHITRARELGQGTGMLFSAGWTKCAIQPQEKQAEAEYERPEGKLWLLTGGWGHRVFIVGVPAALADAGMSLARDKLPDIEKELEVLGSIACLQWCPCAGAENVLAVAAGRHVQVIRVDITVDSSDVDHPKCNAAYVPLWRFSTDGECAGLAWSSDGVLASVTRNGGQSKVRVDDLEKITTEPNAPTIYEAVFKSIKEPESTFSLEKWLKNPEEHTERSINSFLEAVFFSGPQEWADDLKTA